MSRFFKNHFQMVWGEGRFLSELPREAPEVGGLDNRDPESSIICCLSTTAALQIIRWLSCALTPRRGDQGAPGGAISEAEGQGSDSPRVLGQRCCLPLAARRPGGRGPWQSRGLWLALHLPYLTPARGFGPKGAPVCPAVPTSGNRDLGNECDLMLLMFLFLFQK